LLEDHCICNGKFEQKTGKTGFEIRLLYSKTSFFQTVISRTPPIIRIVFLVRPNSYTIALVELLIIRTPIIRTLQLNQWSPRIIKHVVHTL